MFFNYKISIQIFEEFHSMEPVEIYKAKQNAFFTFYLIKTYEAIKNVMYNNNYMKLCIK